MLRPSRDETLMQVAEVFARRGTCSRLQVGCVVARNGRILVTGYNGAPTGMTHCDHTCLCGAMYSELLKNPGVKVEHRLGCPADKICEISVHAEANVTAFAAKYGINLTDSFLVTTASPCLACAQLIVNAGIVGVMYRVEFRDERGLALLKAAGVITEQA
jgi:dCMP deaminase